MLLHLMVSPLLSCWNEDEVPVSREEVITVFNRGTQMVLTEASGHSSANKKAFT